MSLLDDVSIVVTPNAYKAGTLYGVIPTATEGSDLVTNGGFDTDSDWSGSGSNGWTISGGKASNDGTVGSNNLSQSGILLVDKRYKIEITVSNYVSGNVEVSAGATPRGTMTANGTYTFYQTCTPSTTFYIIANSFDGSVDNVSVKEWTASDMDFTRATAGTRVDENGLVNYADVLGSELVTNGGFTADAVWVKSPSGVTIDGSGFAYFTSGQDTYVFQSIMTIGKQYSISLDYNITSISSGYFGSNFGSGNAILSMAGLSGSGTLSGIITATNSILIIRSSTFDGTITNVSVKEVTRNNVPRIDYTGGGCPHILAEPQRTNLVTYSEEISQYIETNTTVIDNNTTSPDGTVNASKITKDGISANDRVMVDNLVISNTTNYSLSAFIKNDDIVNGGVSTIAARVTGGTLFRRGYEWSGSGLSFSTSYANGTRTNEILEDYGNGWWRVGFSFTSDGTEADIEIDIDRENGTDTTAIFLWGTQVEAGSYPTSYIPTSGSTVTRNQDQFTRDGIASLINSTEGVLFAEISALSDDNTGRYYSLSDGTSSNRIRIGYSFTDNTIRALVISQGNTAFDYTHTTSDIKLFSKVAFSYKQDDFSFWIDGVEVHSDTSGNTPTALSRLSFDDGKISGTGGYFYGKVKQLQVYDTALTDAQLISLTS